MSWPQEWDFIWGLIRLQRPKTVVEIGVGGGLMAHSIYTAMNYNYNDTGIESWYTGFDLWDWHGIDGQFPPNCSLEMAEARLKKIGPRYRLVKIDTQKDQKLFQAELAQRFTDGIDFAFIDGCHSYQGVKNDFNSVMPYMNEQGIIAFHDTSVIDGCREFVIDLRLTTQYNSFDIIDFPYGSGKRNCGVTIFVKRGHGNVKIDEICGSPSVPEEIYLREKNYKKTSALKME